MSFYRLTVNALEKPAKCCLGVQMYSKIAELLQRPRVMIIESSMSALAAAVAAPMRKL